jgi:hypothetical protein
MMADTAADSAAAVAAAIAKVAAAVARNGPALESKLRDLQGSNPRYAFLLEGSPHHAQYRAALLHERQQCACLGHSVRAWGVRERLRRAACSVAAGAAARDGLPHGRAAALAAAGHGTRTATRE